MAETRILYNDTCPICAREIGHYRKLARKDDLPIVFAPLSTDAANWGLDRDAAARKVHVRQGDRQLDGLDAFVVIWDMIPRYRWLAWLCRLPVVGTVARAIYDRIAAPLLFALHKRRERRRSGHPAPDRP